MNESKIKIKKRRGLDIIVHGYNDVQGVYSPSIEELISSYRGGSIVLWEMPVIKGLHDVLTFGKRVSYEAFKEFFTYLTPVVCKELYSINKKAKEIFPVGGSMNSDPLNNYQITCNVLSTIIDEDIKNDKLDIYVGEGHRLFVSYVLRKLNFFVKEECHTINQVNGELSKESLFRQMILKTPKRVIKKLKRLIEENSHLDTNLVNKQYTV